MTPPRDKKPAARLDGLRDAMSRKREPASRSYRYLAHLIERAYPRGEGGTALAVCCTDGDALAGDMVLMQAYCLQSEIGASVLMIDARARDVGGGISDRLGLESQPGYADMLLRGGADLDALVRRSGVDQVDVLPQGSGNGSVVVHRAHLSALIAHAKTRYDYVLLQLGSVIADTRNLVTATHADAVLLIAREDQTLMRELAATQELLEANGVEDVRVVLAAKPA